MPNRIPRAATSVARQTAELALAAPQVVAHRMLRMAAAGAQPSARDQREFTLMVAEKQDAFTQAWTAMALQSMSASQSWMLGWMRLWSMPWAPGVWGGQALVSQWQNAAWSVAAKGLAPVRRTAVANAKRLNRGG